MQELQKEWNEHYFVSKLREQSASGRPQPVLVQAVSLERHRQLRLLLDAGVNVDCQDPDTGHTSLIRAMFIENYKHRRSIIKTLLSYDAKIAKTDHQRRTAFSWACLLARNDILKYFFEKKTFDIGIDSVDCYGNDNLALACISGNPTTVRLIAEAFRRQKIDMNRRNYSNNENALMAAHRLGHYECVRVLVEGGYIKTSLQTDLLYGKRKSSSNLGLRQSFPGPHPEYLSLPLIFSVYSDHLTASFPHSKGLSKKD